MTRAQQIVLSAIVLVSSSAAALGQSSGPSDKADALWEAARNGDAPTVKRLLDEGVNVDTKFRYGATALSYAFGSGGSFSASPVAADGKIYFASEDGDIFVVKAGPSYELLATNSIGEVVMATPAISSGVMIVRGLKDLFAIGRRR